MPDAYTTELFPETSFELSGHTNVPLSPVTVGELPPAVCEQAVQDFVAPSFDLATAVPRCRYADLHPDLIEVANKLYARYPFKVNSAYRSVEWDKAHHRNGKSSHCKGLAMDIAAPDHTQRLRLVVGLVELGVRRIGIAKTFIHFDIDPDKAPSIWLYHPDNVNKMF